MDYVTEYRKRARDCIELANRVPDSAPILLTIAEAWTALAAEAERREGLEKLIEHKSNAPSVFKMQ
jgi:hypothetical protein